MGGLSGDAGTIYFGTATAGGDTSGFTLTGWRVVS
jgi:hypothetical protein